MRHGNESKNMKRKIYVAFFALLLFLDVSSQCQKTISLDSLQILNFRKYDLVFLGEVMELDTIAFVSKIKIYELFKGNTTSVFIEARITNSYTYVPEPSGLWLIYANLVSDSIISISDNSLSRSNINPDRIFYYTPEPPMNKKDKRDYPIQAINLKINALTEWNNELYKLRNGIIH
jgi:hypothetical protein